MLLIQPTSWGRAKLPGGGEIGNNVEALEGPVKELQLSVCSSRLVITARHTGAPAPAQMHVRKRGLCVNSRLPIEMAIRRRRVVSSR